MMITNKTRTQKTQEPVTTPTKKTSATLNFFLHNQKVVSNLCTLHVIPLTHSTARFEHIGVCDDNMIKIFCNHV